MTYLIGSLLLRLGGWRIHGELPDEAAVVAIAPHTSNWDFYWLLLVKWKLRLRPRFLGKHTLFRGPLGWFMYSLGGIPVDRSKTAGLVEQAAGVFRDAPGVKLAIAPEGTRRLTESWKSGFYEIARTAGVPVVPVTINYERRGIIIGQPLALTGDRRADMDRLREFFEAGKGRNPEQQGPVLLREE